MDPGIRSAEPAGGNELSVYGDLCHQQSVSTRLEEVHLVVFKRGGKGKRNQLCVGQKSKEFGIRS